MKPKRVSVAEAKNHLPALIHEAESSSTPVEITRRGKTVAVLVSRTEYVRRAKPKEGLVKTLAHLRKRYGKDFGFTEDEVAALRTGIAPPRDFSFDED